MKTIFAVILFAVSSVSGGVTWIDLNPPANRTEFVSDQMGDFSKWIPETYASFGNNFFIFVGKDFRISFDLASGKTKITGRYKPDAAAREFFALMDRQCKRSREQDRQREINEAVLKILKPILDR